MVILLRLAVLIIFRGLFWSCALAGNAGPRKVYLSEMKQCPGRENLPIMGLNFTLDRGNKTQHLLSGDIVISEPFPKGFKVNLDIKSCEDMTDKSTCKPFLSQLATDDICLLLKTPLPSYTTFVRGTSPPLICPLQNTTYKFRNFLVPNDLARFMRRSDKQIYYFNRIKGTKNGRLVVCFQFYMYAAAINKISQ